MIFIAGLTPRKRARFRLRQSMTEKFSKQRWVRRCINHADYTKTTEELTTVRFIVNGLEGHYKYSGTAGAINISVLPKLVNIIEDRLIKEVETIKTQKNTLLRKTGYRTSPPILRVRSWRKVPTVRPPDPRRKKRNSSKPRSERPTVSLPHSF